MTDATATSPGLALPLMRVRGARRRIAAFSALLLIVLAAGAALFLVQATDRQLGDIAEAEKLRQGASDFLITLMEAETSQRGFLITGDDRFLQSYNASIAGVDEGYSSLVALVAPLPAQRARIGSIAEALERKKTELAQTVALAGEGRAGEAMTLLDAGPGRRAMEDIRTTIGSIITTEDAVLVNRNSTLDGTRKWLVASILAALAGSVILASMLFRKTRRDVLALSRTHSDLLTQNEALEQRVSARTAELEEARSHADRERHRVEALLRDSSHRIGNSLATVSSLLGLQVLRARSDEVRAALEAARGRVHAIASGHRRLRLGDDLETVRADEFLEAVVEDLRLMQSPKIQVEVSASFLPVILRARDATTIAIVLGELITNATKHAFAPSVPGKLGIALERQDGKIVLIVEDDGKGIDKKDPEEPEGLGSVIVRQLAQPFGGRPEYLDRAGGGTRVVVHLPALEIVSEPS